MEIYNDPFIFKYKQKNEIASQLNIAPATLSRTLKKFKNLNILNDNFEVINHAKLRGYVN